MVGRLTLLKMLHCNKLNRHKRQQNTFSSPKSKIKIEQTVCDQRNLCRVCLTEGNLPIFGNYLLEDISQELVTFADIQVQAEDSYPKYLCQMCYSRLQTAILFRKTAQETQQLLINQLDITETNDYTENNFEFDRCDEEIIEKQDAELVNYECKRCEQSFNSYSEFSDHMLSSEHENLRRTCTECNKSVKAANFKKHMALHNADTIHVCDVCGKKFVTPHNFARHRLTHFHNFPFKCTVCPYRGRFQESLKMHMRSHTGERPYQCSECPSRFTSKSNLIKHARIHKPDHDFKCESCGRGFYTKKTLEQHFKVDHTGIKDHVCDICGKAFGFRKQMMKHQLKVHKRQKFKTGRMPLYLMFQKNSDLEDATKPDILEPS